MLALIEGVNKVVLTSIYLQPHWLHLSLPLGRHKSSAQQHDSDGQYFPMVMAKANNG